MLPFMYIVVSVVSGNIILADSFAAPDLISSLYSENPLAVCSLTLARSWEFWNSSVLLWRFFTACLRIWTSSIFIASEYLWLNSWKLKLLCLKIWAAIALLVLISNVMSTISNGDQCLCFIKNLRSLGDVSVLFWFSGLLTLAQ